MLVVLQVDPCHDLSAIELYKYLLLEACRDILFITSSFSYDSPTRAGIRVQSLDNETQSREVRILRLHEDVEYPELVNRVWVERDTVFDIMLSYRYRDDIWNEVQLS